MKWNILTDQEEQRRSVQYDVDNFRYFKFFYVFHGAGVVQSLTRDRAIEVRSPVEVTDFSSSLCVQTSSEAHPASYPVGTGGPYPGG
jgi:hypothetical protein